MKGLDAIVQVLRGREDVALAYLFGSRAEGRARPDSDFDVAVTFDPPLPIWERLALQHELSQAAGAPVDLISLAEAPIDLAFAAVARGRKLHERSVEDRVETLGRIYSRYGDYLPVLRAQRRRIVRGTDGRAALRRYRAALENASRLRR